MTRCERISWFLHPTRSPQNAGLIFRTWAQVIAESGSPGGTEPRPYYDFLEGCLRHKSEMVIMEAARAICNMKEVSSRCSPRK